MEASAGCCGLGLVEWSLMPIRLRLAEAESGCAGVAGRTGALKASSEAIGMARETVSHVDKKRPEVLQSHVESAATLRCCGRRSDRKKHSPLMTPLRHAGHAQRRTWVWIHGTRIPTKVLGGFPLCYPPVVPANRLWGPWAGC
jgi:hypothetical protein